MTNDVRERELVQWEQEMEPHYGAIRQDWDPNYASALKEWEIEAANIGDESRMWEELALERIASGYYSPDEAEKILEQFYGKSEETEELPF